MDLEDMGIMRVCLQIWRTWEFQLEKVTHQLVFQGGRVTRLKGQLALTMVQVLRFLGIHRLVLVFLVQVEDGMVGQVGGLWTDDPWAHQ
jgi:hypothetical protein